MTIRPSLSDTTIGYDWGAPQYRKGSIVNEQFDEAYELTNYINQTKERIKHLEDMDRYELLDIKQPSVDIVVIRGEIKDDVIRLILKDEQKTLAKLEKALEVL